MIDELDYYREVDLPIFQREFADWLPSRIFDVHTHSWLLEHLLRPFSEERGGVVFEAESESWEELSADYALLFPGKTVEMLVFAQPMTVIDREANNRYIALHIDNQQSYGLFVPGLEDKADVLKDAIYQGRFIGFKPYLSFVTWKEPEAIRIIDYVLPAQLEVADAYGLIIMLHIPRKGRLADPDNLADLQTIASRYPHARIVMAHGGRAYGRKIIETGLDVLAQFPNVYFDLSNVQDIDVARTILKRLPLERVMYATDIPMATMRGLMLMMNGQRLYITRKHYPWSVTSERPGQLRCTFIAYEGLRAIKWACDDLGFDAAAVKALFYDNARALVTGAAQIHRK